MSFLVAALISNHILGKMEALYYLRHLTSNGWSVGRDVASTARNITRSISWGNRCARLPVGEVDMTLVQINANHVAPRLDNFRPTWLRGHSRRRERVCRSSQVRRRTAANTPRWIPAARRSTAGHTLRFRPLRRLRCAGGETQALLHAEGPRGRIRRGC
jgi:hypothetical protein